MRKNPIRGNALFLSAAQICGFTLCFLFFLFSSTARAESFLLTSTDARWIAGMIFQNECSLRTECLTTWNEGEDFLSLGIGHFIWYPKDRPDRYRESFPEFLNYLEKNGKRIPAELKSLVASGPPWKTRAEFLAEIDSPQTSALRQFLQDTMQDQALFMIQRFQTALSKIVEASTPAVRSNTLEKIIALLQSRNGLYAMIDYINFKGDGLLSQERYNAYGWGLFQVLNEMSWPAGTGGAEYEFVEAARKVLRRRVDNAPSERMEERWIQGWEKRVETYSAPSEAFNSELQGAGVHTFANGADAIEVFSLRDLTVK